VAQDDQALYTEFTMTPESEQAREFAVAMAKVASDTKVQDLVVLHVEPLISWTSYMVICTVFSKPQLMAVLARMDKAATEEWDRTKQNSVGSSPWEVMDYGDVVVHVFTAEQRDYYDIDSYYAAAEEVELPFEVETSSGAAAGSSSSSGGAMGSGSCRAGPAWSKQQIA
jgi:ribosome silencing factor RsfS/YbeB/iojap